MEIPFLEDVEYDYYPLHPTIKDALVMWVQSNVILGDQAHAHIGSRDDFW